MLVKTDTTDLTDKRAQKLQEIARIEQIPSGPAKWQAIRDFTLKLHPGYIPAELDFIAAVKEIREVESFSATGKAKGGGFRHALKIPQYIYTALVTLDPQLNASMSSTSPETQDKTLKQLFNAFPMYRACRKF